MTFPLKRFVLYLFFAGLIIYFLGTLVGFYRSFLAYMLHPYSPILNFFYFAPFLIFEIYPRFVLVFSTTPSLIFYGRFSILSIILFIFAVSAIGSTYLERFSTALFFSVLTSLTTIAHYGFLGSLVGFEPAGFTINVYQLFNIGTIFLIVFSGKNLYLIVLAAILFVTGMNVLFAILFQEKIEQISVIPIVAEKFNKLKSIHRATLIPFGIIHVVIVFHIFLPWFISYEFPYFSQGISGYTIIFYSFFAYLLLISIPVFLEWIAYRRSRKILAEAILPILSREFVNMEPLIQIWDFKIELGLASADRRHFREVLGIASKMVEKKETIHFGFLRNYIYLIEPLTQIVKEKIRQDGQAEINEIAKEINVDPKKLMVVYRELKKKKILENVKVIRNKITPI